MRTPVLTSTKPGTDVIDLQTRPKLRRECGWDNGPTCGGPLLQCQRVGDVLRKRSKNKNKGDHSLASKKSALHLSESFDLRLGKFECEESDIL